MKSRTMKMMSCAAAAVMTGVMMISSIAAASDDGGIPQIDGDKVYNITFSNTYWCDSSYEHGGYIESMIENALNVEIDVKTLDTSTTLDLMLASGEMPDILWCTKSAD